MRFLNVFLNLCIVGSNLVVSIMGTNLYVHILCSCWAVASVVKGTNLWFRLLPFMRCWQFNSSPVWQSKRQKQEEMSSLGYHGRDSYWSTFTYIFLYTNMHNLWSSKCYCLVIVHLFYFFWFKMTCVSNFYTKSRIMASAGYRCEI